MNKAHNDAYYHSMAGAFHGRTVGLSGDATGRAVMPMSDGWRKYRRFVDAEPVWITDADGVPRWLTPTQARVASALLAVCDAGAVTWTALAAELKVAVSTVSRAAVKLMAYGIIAYVTGRGRYGGTIVVRRGVADGLDRFRKLAKAKVRAWSKAAYDRISRLRVNVATYESMKVEVSDISTNTTSSLGRNIEWWSVDDLREAGIL